MQAMSVFRSWQLDAMRKNLATLEYILKTIHDEAIFEKRDGGNGWTISEVLGHLADVEATFMERAQLTVNEDNPALPFPDPETSVRDAGYASQAAMPIFERWRTNRSSFLNYLGSLPDDESVWERSAQHPNRGNFTLNDQLMLAAWHDTNHIQQIVNIVNL